MKRKSDAFQLFKDWKNIVEAQFEKKVKIVLSDNGGEYCSYEFENYLKNNNIIHQTTIARTPEQNGVAERKKRSLVEMMRCMLSDANMPKHFWAEALSTANYIINRCPASSLNGKTPYEYLNGNIPNISHLRVFGCIGYVHIDKEERKKLDFKARKCIFLGYSLTKKAYRLYDVRQEKVICSRNVIFDENKNFTDFKTSNEVLNRDIDGNELFDGAAVDDSVIPEIEDVFYDVDPGETDTDSENVRISSRNRRPPDYYGEWCNLVNGFEPSTVKEALDSANSCNWKQAMDDEIACMKNNNVWDLSELPKNGKIIRCKWIFKRKTNGNGDVKYKARLVAKGYEQELGFDYDYEDISSPVARFESIRTLLVYGMKLGMEFHHMDVTSAFLNGNLKETIYMSQPEGYISENENLVCRLKKAIYGLKQASRCWNNSFSNKLIKFGFQQSVNDPCLYVYKRSGILCFIILYVDDILIGCQSKSFISKIKSYLSKTNDMKDLGKANEFLGINIVQNYDGIFIHQSNFVESLLKRFNFSDCRPISTPADISLKLNVTKDDDELFDKEKYQSIIGALLFLSTRTRPDISFSVGNAARYVSNPSVKHWIAVKRILRYLKGTSSYGIFYERNKISECVGYSDSDWAGNLSDRKSTSGYCFCLGHGLISWRSNNQSCVALSTAEAEFIALSTAAQEAVWLKKLLFNLGMSSEKPLEIFEDNNSTICIVKSFKNHSKMKHVDIKYNYVKDVIKDDVICVTYCSINDNLANIFTKGLSSERFCKLRSLIGVCKI